MVNPKVPQEKKKRGKGKVKKGGRIKLLALGYMSMGVKAFSKEEAPWKNSCVKELLAVKAGIGRPHSNSKQ